LQTALKAGIAINGKAVPVAIVVKDSQSNPNRAGEVANDLDPEGKGRHHACLGHARNGQSCERCMRDQRDAMRLHVVPWQPWFFGRKGDPKKGFRFTYHFFLGP